MQALVHAARELLELKRMKQRIEKCIGTLGEKEFYAEHKEAAWDKLEAALAGGDKYHLPSSLETQQGGGHYKQRSIQPVEYAFANNLNCNCFSAVKYVTRHGEKGKEVDLKKAIHFIQFELEFSYGIRSRIDYDDGKPVKHSDIVTAVGHGG